jgi:predicted DNA-binding protein
MGKETIYPIRIPEDMKHQLAVLACKERRSMAWIIRDILQNYLNTRKSQTQNNTSRQYTKENSNGS